LKDSKSLLQTNDYIFKTEVNYQGGEMCSDLHTLGVPHTRPAKLLVKFFSYKSLW